MPEFIPLTVSPAEEVIQKLQAKVPVASKLKTKEWAQVPFELRDRAMFSAAVDDLRTVQSFSDKLKEWSDFANKDPERAYMNRGKFVSEMRQELGAAPGDSGDMEDITSQRRLELIYDFQTQDAAEYASWKWGNDPDVLDAFPAQELIRVEERHVPRGYKLRKGVMVVDPGKSWRDRWERAGGQFYDGRLIALKTDDIWEKISAFDKPWPPFDFQSGMGLQDIARDEAEELGLIEPGQTLQSRDADFNSTLGASRGDLDESRLSDLKSWFPGRISVAGDTISWLTED